MRKEPPTSPGGRCMAEAIAGLKNGIDTAGRKGSARQGRIFAVSEQFGGVLPDGADLSGRFPVNGVSTRVDHFPCGLPGQGLSGKAGP